MKQSGETQRESISKHPLGTPASAHTAVKGKLDSARHKTEEKMFWRQEISSRKKEQDGYKIVHFHTKFISSLGLQAVLSY